MPFLPPARVSDFDRSANPETLKAAWHERVERQIDRYRALPRFLDPLAADDTAVRDSFPWSGFPRIFDAWLDTDNRPDQIERAHRSAEIPNRFIFVRFNGDTIRIPPSPDEGLMLFPEIDGAASLDDGFALSERPQDEYLEWHVVRNATTNKIDRIDFTVEAPEYWETLAEGDTALAAELYSELLGTAVPRADLMFRHGILCPDLISTGDGGIALIGHVPLFPGSDDFSAGSYNRHNIWNTRRGAIHLTQSANTLFAEINLAARATQRFAARPDLATAVDRFVLTACGGFGAVNRNSDPTIGDAVNGLVLSGFEAMVSNPIGLYVGSVELSGFRDPNGDAVDRDEIFTLHRGSFHDEDGLARVLRFSVHPPEGANYSLDDCSLDGRRLTTGGPIARQTTVVIHGIAMASDRDNPVVPCRDQLCEHVSKRPKYFLTADANQPCPPPENQAWQRVPVPIAPDFSEMLARPVAGSLRDTSTRG